MRRRNIIGGKGPGWFGGGGGGRRKTDCGEVGGMERRGLEMFQLLPAWPPSSASGDELGEAAVVKNKRASR